MSTPDQRAAEPCGWCDGEGWIELGELSETPGETVDCPLCDGAGWRGGGRGG